MKQLFLSLIIFCCTLNIYAEKDVTTFLGIPVDGTKEEMFQKLRQKGFIVSPHNPEVLIGEFNGEDVEIVVVTNKNRVWRIGVLDTEPKDEIIIKRKFNRLCSQFENHENYISPVPQGAFNIPEDEDISFEMAMGNKLYSATFYQMLKYPIDTIGFTNLIKETLLSEIPEKIDTITPEMTNDVKEQLIRQIISDKIEKKSVGVAIMESNGQYVIGLCYDNMYNQANGEDL